MAPTADSPAARPDTPAPEVWLLFCSGYDRDRNPGAAELADAFEGAFGPRCAVLRSSELLLGVRGGRLTLADLHGRPLAAPRVVYARMSTPRLGADRELTLLRHLRAMGAVLLNPVEAVLAGVNKFWQLQQLALAGVPVLDSHSYVDAPLAQVIAAGVPEPCVVKAVRGNRGKEVFLATDAAMLTDIHGALSEDSPYLFQEYLEFSRGRDLRVVVVDGVPVAAFERACADGGLKANISLGGTPRLCLGEHSQAEALAVRAAAAVGLPVAGVDLLHQPDGGFVVCEVNPNVSLREWCGGIVPAIVAACAARLQPALHQ
ncbi:RimK family alpha-L-glutamate ligase [Kitasatospora sp. NBC_01266]|uniref:RimK family alpha-L-glutamate ligase n=1 Tax=Kitasatospora sp. NBC_01266 TaxID=2903572 RepID=UPI002E307D00|nr:RimK family alpha-L-glutamate ligase [Kitasatospora sp. NBC_01266]